MLELDRKDLDIVFETERCVIYKMPFSLNNCRFLEEREITNLGHGYRIGDMLQDYNTFQPRKDFLPQPLKEKNILLEDWK